MTSLTLVVLALLVLGIVRASFFPRLLALAGATPMGAALVVGEIAIPTFYAVSVGAAVGIGLRLLERTRLRQRLAPGSSPGATPLLAFTGVAIVVTLMAPIVFFGTPVLQSGGRVRPLEPTSTLLTTSNIAQLVYLLLSVAVVFYLARSSFTTPGLLGVTLGVVTVLSFWKLISEWTGLPFPLGFFDNSPGFRIIESSPGGAPRFRGIFSEPSALATTSLVTIAYGFSRATRVRGMHRVAVIVMTGMAILMASVSTSTTFTVAGVALVMLALIVMVSRVLFRGVKVSALSVTVGCVVAIAALYLLPVVANAIEQTLSRKVQTSSFDERSGSDAFSFQLLIDTWGIGVGLGSNRPSSFVASMAAATGIIGVILLAAVFWILVRGAWRVDAYRPVAWAFITLMIAKAIAAPDLADPSGVTWLALGILAHASWSRYRPAGSGVGTSPSGILMPSMPVDGPDAFRHPYLPAARS